MPKKGKSKQPDTDSKSKKLKERSKPDSLGKDAGDSRGDKKDKKSKDKDRSKKKEKDKTKKKSIDKEEIEDQSVKGEDQVSKDTEPDICIGDGKESKDGCVDPVDCPTTDALRQFGPLRLETRQAQTAIVLLDSKEIHVIIESLNSLQKFVSRRVPNRELFAVLGGLCRIMRFLHHPHLIIQRLALKVLAITAEIQKIKTLAINFKLAKELPPLLKSIDPVVVEYSTVIALNLATMHEGRLHLIHFGCIPLIMNLTTHPDPDIQKNCLQTMVNLLTETTIRPIFEKLSIVRMVLPLINSEFAEVQIPVLGFYEQLTHRPCGFRLVEDSGVIDLLKGKLGNLENPGLQQIALRLLLNLTKNVDNIARMVVLIPELQFILLNSCDVNSATLTANLFGKLARNPMVAKHIVDSQAILPRLIQFSKALKVKGIRQVAILAAAQIASTYVKSTCKILEVFKPIGPCDKAHVAGGKSKPIEPIFLALALSLSMEPEDL